MWDKNSAGLVTEANVEDDGGKYGDKHYLGYLGSFSLIVLPQSEFIIVSA